MFKEITEAYEVLQDPLRRKSYDRQMGYLRTAKERASTQSWGGIKKYPYYKQTDDLDAEQYMEFAQAFNPSEARRKQREQAKQSYRRNQYDRYNRATYSRQRYHDTDFPGQQDAPRGRPDRRPGRTAPRRRDDAFSPPDLRRPATGQRVRKVRKRPRPKDEKEISPEVRDMLDRYRVETDGFLHPKYGKDGHSGIVKRSAYYTEDRFSERPPPSEYTTKDVIAESIFSWLSPKNIAIMVILCVIFMFLGGVIVMFLT